MLGSGGSCRLACGEVFAGREENKDSTDDERSVLVKLLNLSKIVLHSLNMPPHPFPHFWTWFLNRKVCPVRMVSHFAFFTFRQIKLVFRLLFTF